MTSRSPSRWPALLMSRPFSGLYDDGHLHDAKQITGFFPDTTFLGDIRSFNWNGGSDLTTPDAVATAGLLIDMSVGSAQFEGDVFVNLIRDSTVDADLASGAYLTWGVTGTGTNRWGTVFLTTPTVDVGVGNWAFLEINTEPLDGVPSANRPGFRLFATSRSGVASPAELQLDHSGDHTPFRIIWNSDTDTYITSAAADQLNFWAGGVEMLRLTEDTADQVLLGISGADSAPALAQIGDPDTGVLWPAADRFGISAGGVLMMLFIEDTNDQVFLGNFGSTTVPSLSRIDDPNSGLSLRGSDAGGIIMGGTEVLTFAAGFASVPAGSRFQLNRADLTIATGAITVTGSFHRVDTEAAAATDDLDTINGGVNGTILVLMTVNNARDVTLRDGVGNLQLAGNFTLSNTQDKIVLIFTDGGWHELSRSDNA